MATGGGFANPATGLSAILRACCRGEFLWMGNIPGARTRSLRRRPRACPGNLRNHDWRAVLRSARHLLRSRFRRLSGGGGLCRHLSSRACRRSSKTSPGGDGLPKTRSGTGFATVPHSSRRSVQSGGLAVSLATGASFLDAACSSEYRCASSLNFFSKASSFPAS